MKPETNAQNYNLKIDCIKINQSRIMGSGGHGLGSHQGLPLFVCIFGQVIKHL